MKAPGNPKIPQPTVAVWEPGSIWRSLNQEAGRMVSAVAISADGNHVAACLEQTVKVWDANNGAAMGTFTTEGFAHAIAFSTDGLRLVAATEDGLLHLWSTPGKQASRVLERDGGRITTIRFDNHGRTLAGGVRSYWALPAGTPLANAGNHPQGEGRRVALAPSTSWLAGAPDSALRNLDTNQTVALHEHDARSQGLDYSFSHDGRLVAEASGGSSRVTVWDTTTGERLRTWKTKPWTGSLAFSPDNRWLAVGCGYNNPQQFDPFARGGTLQVWEVNTGREVYPAEDFTSNIWSVAFSPDGKFLAAGMGDYSYSSSRPGSVRIWDTATWRVVHNLRGHRLCVYSVAFSPDGSAWCRRAEPSKAPMATSSSGTCVRANRFGGLVSGLSVLTSVQTDASSPWGEKTG